MYNRQMAKENKIMLNRAISLLRQYGYDAAIEQQTVSASGALGRYTHNLADRAIRTILAEHPHVADRRAIARVYRALTILRMQK